MKTERKDILRQKEIQTILRKANPQTQCLVGLLWAYGKRISENLSLTRENVYVANGYLHVRFQVLKKRKKGEFYLKRLTLQHPAVPYILQYTETIKEGPLFPNLSRQLAYYYLKKLSKQIYPHLFRKSLATEMSERSFTVQQLMSWFDWTAPNVAMAYVSRGVGLTKELSERTW